VKKLSNEEAYYIMIDWLDKCNELETLNFNGSSKIKEGLKVLIQSVWRIKGRKQSFV
jgi:hypothetical protein